MKQARKRRKPEQIVKAMRRLGHPFGNFRLVPHPLIAQIFKDRLSLFLTAKFTAEAPVPVLKQCYQRL
ncbi:hypothetical protein [Crateriforma conspicua]|uniref:hypothetical protein n=1 Tax=Crateriforma conspicua TaxID=2527996 RepID=UPI001189A16B|nr:hypothetical protein [Crateriforma conspicua]QDV62450.1 hypothetical protein Mal65_15840 [Crateriforma conspicua]